MAEKRFYRGFAEVCAGAGVRRIRPYDSRSTWTTLSKGKMPEYVAVARAGHSQAVRDEHYARELDEELREAALSLEELIGR
jgi:integrase